MNKISHSFTYGNKTVTLETGEIARQADGAVIIDIEGTKLLVTAVFQKKAEEGRDFFPLTVNYQEKYYSCGRIPGGYFRREGRPTENETLIARLIDRPLRPLFPEGFVHDVQIIASVLSYSPDVNPDIAAIIGSSAALAISGVPFHGPLGAARVGYSNGSYILNPSEKELENSDLDLVVAGTKDAVLMVESEANLLSEDIMLGAVSYGHQQMQTVIDAISELCNKVGVTPFEWTATEKDTTLKSLIKENANSALTEAYQISNKQERYARIAEINQEVVDKILNSSEEGTFEEKTILNYIHDLEKDIVRSRILDGLPRIDGRDTTSVRKISSKVGVLPRTHGSALFTRGETQALVTTTLGTTKDAQMIDSLAGDKKEGFIFHYNFPPFSVGETGMVGSPKRREIGHGRLAKRGVQAVMPNESEFPYTIRVVSEITESNGSSSMASVCGSSLSLMNAGVPIKSAVAGIAMGLIKDNSSDKYAVLTDILGDEDHLGDMDFKVAGTKDGITALQMDIKIKGITEEIMQKALSQAKVARLHILDEMATVLSIPNSELSEFAPRYTTMNISPDKIKDVIGKGGATIRSITEKTGAAIDIKNDGEVIIATTDKETANKVCEMIKELTTEPEVGKIYSGVVARITDFGAFVTFMPGQDGLVHISKISNERVENVKDYLKEGQEVSVRLIEIDKQGRVRLSMKPSDLED